MNGEKSQRIRVLFDSGSHCSFISSSLVDKLNLTPLCSEKIAIKPFGTTEVERRVRDIVKIYLSPINSNNDGGEGTKLKAMVVDNVTDVPKENFHLHN